MADEITKACCQQNRESCSKFMQVKFDAARDVSDAKADAVAMALLKAEEKMEIRLHGLNAYKDASKDYITKNDHENIVKTVTEMQLNKVGKIEFDFQVREIEQLRLSAAKLAGKADQSALTWAYLISTIGIVLGIIGVAIHFIK